MCILDSNPSDSSLVTDYMKISEELEFEKVKNLGITIILHTNWMFVAPLMTPYTKMENGMDLFIDPFSYGGIMNFHISKKEWPQTAGIDPEASSVIKNLETSCTNEYIPAEEPPEEAEGDGEGEADGEGNAEGDKEGEGEGEVNQEEEEEEE